MSYEIQYLYAPRYVEGETTRRVGKPMAIRLAAREIEQYKLAVNGELGTQARATALLEGLNWIVYCNAENTSMIVAVDLITKERREQPKKNGAWKFSKGNPIVGA